MNGWAGVTRQEIDAIVEDCRREYMEDWSQPADDESFGFLDMFRRRLPPSNSLEEDEVQVCLYVFVYDDIMYACKG